MAQILQPYRVPVVYNDLNPEETMGDAFYALETLSSTIDDIFNRIERRISDEKRRVDQIKTRVAVCKGKVTQVRGSKKATTVFSTAKFPAPKLLPLYPTLFSQMQEVKLHWMNVTNMYHFCILHGVIFFPLWRVSYSAHVETSNQTLYFAVFFSKFTPGAQPLPWGRWRGVVRLASPCQLGRRQQRVSLWDAGHSCPPKHIRHRPRESRVHNGRPGTTY